MKIQETQERAYKTNIIDVRRHYTPESIVLSILPLIPMSLEDSVLDAGSGKNKVWFNSIKNAVKYECELEDGCDFLEWKKNVDWVIGNPPYHIGWEFLKKSISISNKGIAFLISINGLNSLFTPSRLGYCETQGFVVTKIHVLSIDKWFGRYFFVIYEKGKASILSFEKKGEREHLNACPKNEG